MVFRIGLLLLAVSISSTSFATNKTRESLPPSFMTPGATTVVWTSCYPSAPIKMLPAYQVISAEKTYETYPTNTVVTLPTPQDPNLSCSVENVLKVKLRWNPELVTQDKLIEGNFYRLYGGWRSSQNVASMENIIGGYYYTKEPSDLYLTERQMVAAYRELGPYQDVFLNRGDLFKLRYTFEDPYQRDVYDFRVKIPMNGKLRFKGFTAQLSEPVNAQEKDGNLEIQTNVIRSREKLTVVFDLQALDPEGEGKDPFYVAYLADTSYRITNGQKVTHNRLSNSAILERNYPHVSMRFFPSTPEKKSIQVAFRQDKIDWNFTMRAAIPEYTGLPIRFNTMTLKLKIPAELRGMKPEVTPERNVKVQSQAYDEKAGELTAVLTNPETEALYFTLHTRVGTEATQETRSNIKCIIEGLTLGSNGMDYVAKPSNTEENASIWIGSLSR